MSSDVSVLATVLHARLNGVFLINTSQFKQNERDLSMIHKLLKKFILHVQNSPHASLQTGLLKQLVY